MQTRHDTAHGHCRALITDQPEGACPTGWFGSVTVGHVTAGLDLLSTPTHPQPVSNASYPAGRARPLPHTYTHACARAQPARARTRKLARTHARTQEATFEAVLGTPYTPQVCV